MFAIYHKRTGKRLTPPIPSLAQAEMRLQEISAWICRDTLEIADPVEMEFRKYKQQKKEQKPNLAVVK